MEGVAGAAMLGRRMGPGGRAPAVIGDLNDGAIDPREDDESLSKLMVDERRSSIALVGGTNGSSGSPELRRLLRPESLLFPGTLLVAESPLSLRGSTESGGNESRFSASSSSLSSSGLMTAVVKEGRAGVLMTSGEGRRIIGG